MSTDNNLPPMEAFATLHHDDGYFTMKERDESMGRLFRTEVVTLKQAQTYARQALASQAAAFERKSMQDDETIIWQAEQISRHLTEIERLRADAERLLRELNAARTAIKKMTGLCNEFDEARQIGRKALRRANAVAKDFRKPLALPIDAAKAQASQEAKP